MPTRRDIQYEISPKKLQEGDRWLSVSIKNMRKKELRGIDVRLNSMDTYSIEVLETNRFVPELGPGEETTVFYRVACRSPGNVYLSIDGFENGQGFYWESPSRTIVVGEPRGELVSVFATTKTRFVIGDKITAEATVKSNLDTKGLKLDVWTEAPDETIDEIKSFELEDLEPNKTKIYKCDFEPSLEGLYVVNAELFDGLKRLGHKADYVYVAKA